MDLSIPYLITSSALILFDLFTHKSQSHVSPVIESTESYLSSSRVTRLSDGLSIKDADKSGTELILVPPIDHPMNDYKDRLVNIWSRYDMDGEYEFIEAKILEKSELVNKKIRDSNLSEDIRIGAIVRKDQVIIPRSNFIFEKGDLVVFLAKREQLKAVESIFSVGSI